MLELALIRIDGETQSREKIDEAVVAEYAEAFKAGAQFPPVKVFFDGVHRWLADGFHRYHGAQAAGLTSIYEDIQPGTREEAQLYSYGANGSHGLRRTNADKRRAVEGALRHLVSSAWSDNQIAKHCGVHHSTVGDVRRSLADSASETPTERSYTTKHGTLAVMKTENIGRAGSTPPAAPKPLASQTATAPEPPAPQPTMPPAEPEEPPAPEYSDLDAARDQIADLQADLALAKLGDVPEADRNQAAELIEQLQGEVKGLTAQLRAVTSSRDFLMQENTQMKQQLAAQRREIDRLKAGAA